MAVQSLRLGRGQPVHGAEGVSRPAARRLSSRRSRGPKDCIQDQALTLRVGPPMMAASSQRNGQTTIRSARMAEAKTDKKQALELAIATIERQFGKGSVMRLGANGPLEEIAVIPTGALSLDVALGVGGVPRGRVVEIYGPESSGQTTLALHIVSEAQRLGGTGAFIDAEHALDPIYARKLGVNIDELLISQPDTGEQALEITETLVRSN